MSAPEVVPAGPPPPPESLGEAGARFWREIVAVYTLRPDETRLLLDACGEVDLVDRLAAALRDAPLTVRGSQGQEVASPLVTELRQHRAGLASLLRALRLDDADSDGLTAADKSAAARAAARARWDPPRGVRRAPSA